MSFLPDMNSPMRSKRQFFFLLQPVTKSCVSQPVMSRTFVGGTFNCQVAGQQGCVQIWHHFLFEPPVRAQMTSVRNCAVFMLNKVF